MRYLIKIWDKIFFSKFDPISISLFRIFIGISLLMLFLMEISNWENYYSSNGILSLNDPDINKTTSDNLSIFHFTESIIPVRFYLFLGIISSITFTFGFLTRLSNLILFILVISTVFRNPLTSAGWDAVLRMLLFYSLFVPTNFYFSVDNLINKKKKAFPLIWPVRLMQINFASIYVLTALLKLLSDPAWRNGEAIYWVLVSNQWSIFPFKLLLYSYDGLLSKILTYGTLIIELSFPILVWFRKTVLFILLITTIFHILIAAVMPDVIIFSIVMIFSLWIFIPSDIARDWINRIKLLTITRTKNL